MRGALRLELMDLEFIPLVEHNSISLGERKKLLSSLFEEQAHNRMRVSHHNLSLFHQHLSQSFF